MFVRWLGIACKRDVCFPEEATKRCRMIVDEVIALSHWLDGNVSYATTYLETLASTLDNNAQQSQKLPLREVLDDVREALTRMRLQELSIEQRELLAKNNVLHLLGADGWAWVSKLVMEGEYDPATAATEMKAANAALAHVITVFRAVRTSLTDASVLPTPQYAPGQGVLTRIHFQDKASIHNVVDLQDWSSEWVLISRGIAEAVNERAEDVRVVGASTGSLLIWLASSLAVAKVLAILTRLANRITNDVVNSYNVIENARHSAVMNREIEEMMRENVRKMKETAKSGAVDEIQNHLDHKLTEDTKSRLTLAVERYFDFAEKGGEVDMIAPPTSKEETTDPNLSEQVAEVRKLIEEGRAIKDSLPKLLPGADAAP